ncbi:hypothetical protein [Brockia lithotrophica]|uniref:Uncharacterized protein n=1 Tax=Brockia lithotrophica TaxID=933949 RepID=A0A660LBT8_9BACL|nr:hypothetical protein [Brockia lithotrophica]RKQ89080.1 hypothetical protein C7438_0736 [Brockia lithotrophica]
MKITDIFKRWMRNFVQVAKILVVILLILALGSGLGRSVFDIYYYAGYKLGYSIGSQGFVSNSTYEE